MELYNYVTVQSKQATINEMDGVYVAIALDPAYRSGICTATTSNVNLTVNTMPGGMSPVSGSVSMSSAEVALMVNANNQDIQQLSTTLFDCFVSKQTLNTTIADINDDLANSLRVASAISSRLDLVVDDVDATVTRLGVVDSQIEEISNCGFNGSLTGNPRNTCQAVPLVPTCPDISSLTNATYSTTIDLAHSIPGVKVRFECDVVNRVFLVGPETITCMLNGQWDAAPPACVSCDGFHLDVNGDVSCNTGTTAADALNHCVELMGMAPVPASGMRYIRVNETFTTRLYCSTLTAQDGGGWELGMRIHGGNKPSGIGTSYDNKDLFGGKNVLSTMTPIDPTKANTMTAGTSQSFADRIRRRSSEWLRVSYYLNQAGPSLDKASHHRVRFGSNTSFTTIVSIPHTPERCVDISDPIQFWAAGNYAGQTSNVLLRGGHGLACREDSDTQCGGDYIRNTLNNWFVRGDNSPGWTNTAKHFFTYRWDGDNGRDHVRCSRCCWRCTGKFEVIEWYYRPVV
eukprot:TRINITY_DN12182_c0_g1_i10.p1 TRINITY_DN12182_c0_g1~~TRINITY_DN12182_c0_g1_i10.p1  ORF type:complete len:515 (+),score=104.68 TRINITY_DN12182_c0_g1_i10:889-2433(+)